MSKKAQRRAAVEQRYAARYEDEMEKARVELTDLDWGFGSALGDEVKADIVRLGGQPVPYEASNWTDWFRFGVDWPKQEYRWSARLFRRILVADGCDDAMEWPLEEVEDEMPQCDNDFVFLKSMEEGFWSGWQEEFSRVDAAKCVPLASDGHFFYFLENSSQESSELKIFWVDHEELDETPDQAPWTMARVLSCLEPAKLN